jgi:hypothetical protein
MKFYNLLSLPHLFVRRIVKKEPLIDYPQSHIVSSAEYFAILQQRTLDKATIDNIKEKR